MVISEKDNCASRALFFTCLIILVFNDLGPQSRECVAHLVVSIILGCLMIIKDACGTCTGILDFKQKAINRNLNFTFGSHHHIFSHHDIFQPVTAKSK